ncbi:MAG: cysteine peptidase family C39 domain-containing protein [Acidiferrobacter sp.]
MDGAPFEKRFLVRFRLSPWLGGGTGVCVRDDEEVLSLMLRIDTGPGGAVSCDPRLSDSVGGRRGAPHHSPSWRGVLGLARTLTLCGLPVLSGCAIFNGGLDRVGYLSDSSIVLNVPYEKQAMEYLCGLAASDMVSRYYKHPLSATERARLRNDANRSGGISGRDLKLAFQQSGYAAFVFPGTLNHDVTGLYWNIERRRPLIIMYAQGKGSPGHYVVVAGYDPVRNTFLVLDPARGRKVESRHTLMRDWIGSGHFTLLAIPDQRDKAPGALAKHE